MKKPKKILRTVLRVLSAVLCVVLIAVLGALLILSQPQPDEQKEAAPQPLLPASPALEIRQESELRSLVESFPVPVLSFMSGSGMTFVSGTSADVGLSGGFGRVVTLYWQTEEEEPLILQSIYPASALSLLGSDYHFSAVAGPTLFGAASVRMENDATVRIHAATESGLYVVTLPKSAASRLSALSRSLQLFSVREE